MPRKYTHVKELETEIFAMKEQGKTNREIAEYFGFKDKSIIKGLVKRYNKRTRLIQSGVVPKKKGRPRTTPLTTEQEKTNEIKRLQMENELLRDFIQLVGRG